MLYKFYSLSLMRIEGKCDRPVSLEESITLAANPCKRRVISLIRYHLYQHCAWPINRLYISLLVRFRNFPSTVYTRLFLFLLYFAGSCTCNGIDALVGVDGPGDAMFSAAVCGCCCGRLHGWQTGLLNIATWVANGTCLCSSFTAFGFLSVDWSKWIKKLSPVTMAYSFIFHRNPVLWLYHALALAVYSCLYSLPIIEK